MDTRKLFHSRYFSTLLATLITVSLPSCGFCPNIVDDGLCGLIKDAPLKELTDSQQTVVFEEQGTIIVYHGYGCAESKKSGREDFLRVEQSLNLPAYATNATVFLNGWNLKYLNGDHHVAGLGTAIENIRLDGNTLTWHASGVLSDDDFNDAYSWCYHYTVIAWNPSNLNLTVDHKDGSCDDESDPSQANFFTAENNGTTTALSSFPSFLQNPAFAASKVVAILPRGFGFSWACGVDHHLLQIAYNLDHSEIFIENGKKYKKQGQSVAPSLPNSASQADSGFVSWETSAIFKDNRARRDYKFGEIVSGLGGIDVGVIQPPFSILPAEDSSFCASVGPVGLQTQEFVIEKIPFEFAIPMLTGWELEYGCGGDQHVQEGGVWIDKWDYDKNSGTLRYTLATVLRDEEDGPTRSSSHKVTVLGIRPVARVSTKDKAPDLVPFSPFGNSAAAFCRIEQSTMLRLTVKNQGNDNAPASKTTVTFGDKPLTLDTPPIPAGGTVDLLFKLPTGCFSPDCSFVITVDSTNLVNESTNEGNNSVNGGCVG
ncbi:MAG: hypothetical protein ND866_12535 [Pyrinomonadaceae bacterium]|nr:hypothetical protein [Pyrinomonadaceae bacterium]